MTQRYDEKPINATQFKQCGQKKEFMEKKNNKKDSKKFISFSLKKSDALDSKNDRSVPLLTIQHENWK